MSMNKRGFFRVEFSQGGPAPVPCQWAIRRVADRPVKELYAAGQIQDLSAGGVRIQTEIDLPIRMSLHLGVRFAILGQAFHLTGAVLRKVDIRSAYEYSCAWVDVDPETCRLLLQALNSVALAHKTGKTPRVGGR